MSLYSIGRDLSDLDKQRFGDYISGFVDGEGYFLLEKYDKKKGCFHGRASFGISIRLDDIQILLDIRKFFGCGKVSRLKCLYRGNENPTCRFNLYTIPDLMMTIVPFFEKHPLRAKKKRDFEVWKQGIELLYRVKSRPGRAVMMNGLFAGTQPKWLKSEIDEFMYLFDLLKEVRKYKESDDTPVPKLRRKRKVLTGFF